MTSSSPDREPRTPECGTCHGSEWTDNGCGVVLCPECSVTASTFREAAHEARTATLREVREAFRTLTVVSVITGPGPSVEGYDRAAVLALLEKP